MAFKRLAVLLGVPLTVVILGIVAPGGAQENKNLLPDDKRLIEPRQEKELITSVEGSALFRAYCAACHGSEARGDGPAASSLRGPVPDLTRISKRNGGRYPLVRVQKIISGEGVITSPHGSREMPVWGPIFSQIGWDQDLGNVRIYNLSRYLETLQVK